MTAVEVLTRARGNSANANAKRILDEDGYAHAREVITAWDKYEPTPLVSCPDIASKLGIDGLFVKDESARLGLKSFKSLGGAYAVHRAHERWLAEGADGEFVVTCVTDGNHGLSVASGAQTAGVKCVVYIPDVVTEMRADAITAFGAEVVRIPGNYDEVTRVNAEHAAERGWTIVTDTSSINAELQSVIDVMQGYRVLADEILDEWDDLDLTHVVLQAGCGGMAGAVIGHFLTRKPIEEMPKLVVVEPEQAACLVESARVDGPAVVSGALATMMAGLSVGEISLAAWDILSESVDYFVSISDEEVPSAMRLLGLPTGDRSAIISGETGAAGLAALMSLVHSQQHAVQVGLDASSRVLVINTEGDTDPELYKSIIAG